MAKQQRLRREHARRALFDLKELMIEVLEENPNGLTPAQISTELNILVPHGKPLYGTNRTDIAWGILNALVANGLVEKRGNKAVLTTHPPKH